MAKTSNAPAEAGERQSGETQTDAQRGERKSIDDRIAEAEQEVKRLVELKRRREREAREQRERELRDMLRSEKLDEFPIAAWRATVVQMREMLERASKSV